MGAFNAQSTAAEVLEGQDLSGKRVLITGASGGIGLEAARAVASAGASLVLANRASDKAEKALADLASSVPEADIESLDLNLGSLKSVRACADEYLEKYDALHLMINNAGVMATPLTQTEDGFESQFGTNHLGHFVLTCRLVPLLKESAPARVVNISSAAHRRGAVDIDDPNFENREYDKWESYGQSKTANALFSLELNRRLADSGVKSYSVHPGMIATDLGRHLDEDDIKMMRQRAKDNLKAAEAAGKEVLEQEQWWKTPEQGAATGVWAAVAEELEDHGGVYLEDCSVARANGGEHDPWGYAPYAKDADLAAELWTLSEKMVGETFDF